jgi:RNA polymerase sigma-70 factor (ECF subfamily)
VTFRVDRGKRAGRTVRGRDAVASAILARGARLAVFARPALVNGNAGLVVVPYEQPVAVVAFAVGGGRILEIDVIANRAKLRALA